MVQAMPDKLWNRLSRIEVVISLAAFGGTAVTGALTWLASTVQPIVVLGWGAVVLVGIGGACAITLVVTTCLVGWRYFNPHPPSEMTDQLPSRFPLLVNGEPPPDERMSAVEAQLAQINDDLKTAIVKITELEYIDTSRFSEIRKELARSVHELKIHQNTAETKLMSAISEVKSYAKDSLAGTRDGLLHSIQEIREQQGTTERELERIDDLVRYSFKIRDAEHALIKLDKRIEILFSKLSLARSSDYATGDDWRADFNIWSETVREFWDLISQCTSGTLNPFRLPDSNQKHRGDIREIEFIKSNQLQGLYHTLLLVAQRHLDTREQAYKALNAKALLA